MPKKKAKKKDVLPEKTSKKSNTEKTPSKKLNLKQDISRQLKLDESYMSLVLGAIVVLVLAFLLLTFVKQGGVKSGISAPTPIVQKASPTPKTTTTYILQDGEGLWDVAVKFYGDGNKWTVISDVNNLNDDPNDILPGMKLIIPPSK